MKPTYLRLYIKTWLTVAFVRIFISYLHTNTTSQIASDLNTLHLEKAYLNHRTNEEGSNLTQTHINDIPQQIFII